MPPANKNKGKGKRDGTPEKTDEEKEEGQMMAKRAIIFDEALARLKVTDDDLKNLVSEEEYLDISKSNVSLRKTAILKEIPENERPPVMKGIGLLRPAPPSAPLAPPDLSGGAGPRFDVNGHVIQHSILGPIEDFYRVAYKRGHLPIEEVPLEYHSCITGTATPAVQGTRTACLPVTPRSHKSVIIGGPRKDPNRAALENWETKMTERRRQMNHVSNSSRRPLDQMVMNQAEEFRWVQEERYLIDRTLPFYDHGKDPRVGSEFWKQQEVIGDSDERELQMTLSQTERGYPPTLEHIGLSRIARRETGLDYEPTQTPRYPWKFPYYQARQNQMADVLDELDPLPRPIFDDLQVVGRQIETERSENQENEEICNGEEEQEEDTRFQCHPEDQDTVSMDVSVPGPSLQLGGQPARWIGDPSSFKGTIGIEARVIFQCHTMEKCTEYLDIKNDGTTVIQYQWKQLAKPNPFELVKPTVRTFYFDTQGGVLLPGETLNFPLIFKSSKAGIFTEQWCLETKPSVCGGADLLVTLRGIALEDDPNADVRRGIETNLRHRMGERIVRSILNELLNGLQIPERPKTPLDTYITQEEIFNRKNPHLYFNVSDIKDLSDIHVSLWSTEPTQDEAQPPALAVPPAQSSEEGLARTPTPQEEKQIPQWNLSLLRLRDDILELSEDDIEKKEKLCKNLHDTVSRMSLLHQLSKARLHSELYRIGYEALSELALKIYDEGCDMREIHGLPQIEFVMPDLSDKSQKSQAGVSGVTTSMKLDKKSTATTGGKGSTSPGKSGRPDTKSTTRPPSGGGKSDGTKSALSSHTTGPRAGRKGSGVEPPIAEGESIPTTPEPTQIDEESARHMDPEQLAQVENQVHDKTFALALGLTEEACGRLEGVWDNCVAVSAVGRL